MYPLSNSTDESQKTLATSLITNETRSFFLEKKNVLVLLKDIIIFESSTIIPFS